MAKKKKVRKKSTKTVKKAEETLALILLGPANYKAEFGGSLQKDYGQVVLGQAFQKKLRASIHKTKSEYKCGYCGGYGVYFIVEDEGKGKEEFLNQLAIFHSLEIDKSTASFLTNLFGTPVSTEKNKGGTYKVATPLITKYLKNTRKLISESKKLYDDNRKAIDKAAAAKINSAIRAKTKDDISPTAALVSDFIDFWKLEGSEDQLFCKCPACDGNGYYDIGHTAFFGKQEEVFRKLYNKYLTGNPTKETWLTPISREEVWELFKEQSIKPEVPYRMKFNYVKDAKIDAEKLTVNRYITFTDQNKRAKEALYSRFYKLYKGEISHLYENYDNGITFEEVAYFYEMLSKTARVKTGALKAYLKKQAREVKLQGTLTGSITNSFISNYVIVRGPTVMERAAYRSTGKRYPSEVNNAYVYATRFVPLTLRDKGGGYGINVDEQPWSRGGIDIESIGQRAFDNKWGTFKIKYFPQRTIE